ncbi:two-partner secretion domain-containing protein [Variovorax gossypii]
MNHCERWTWRAALLAALGVGGPAFAMPQGGAVSAGQGAITVDGNTTTVTQQSGRLAVNWNSFGIGANETVRFVQPGAGAVALNRVLGTEASAIYGRLEANGQVFLLNPNGILFGAGAQVNVGGLVASTLGLGDADFLAGRYRFTSTGLSPAGVTNQGQITASDGGYVALLGGQVSNQGTVVARLGSVAMAAGSDITLDFAGDGLLGLTVNRGALDALVHNGQAIRADGGQVLMTARAADDVVRAAVNNEGVVEARALENRAGRIVLAAEGAKAEIHAGGTLDASGGGRVLADAHAGDLSVDGRVDVSNAQGAGGTVHLLGGRVGLFGNAQVDAGGRDGGGTVLVGGDFQGKNADVHNARQTVLSVNARIDASATGQGNGGRVIVWSDGQTVAQGAIAARGGANGGNGGFVEVSGKDTLGFSARVDTTAAKGSMGTLLLDPTDLDIIDCRDPCGFNTPIIGFGDLPSGGLSTVFGSTLSAATTNVSLQATNSINFYDPVSVAAAGLSLTAEAGNAINVYNTIHAPGTVTLKAPGIYISSSVDAGERVSLLADGLIVSSGAGALVNAPSVTIKPYSDGFGLNIGGSATGSALTISTGTLSGISAYATLTLQGQDITLNTVLNRPGDTVMAADRTFTNTIANGMSSSGRYLVYAADPATSTRNVTSGFSKHYDVSYTGTTPAYASTGNWFFYSVAPTLQITPDGGTVVYGSAVPGGYTLGAGGFIDGDSAASAGLSGTATFGLPTASYSSGGHLNVGTYGMDYTGGLLSSLGYRFVSVPGSSLSVTPASVTVASAPVGKVYDGTTTASFGTVAFSGMLAGDSLGLAGSLHFADANVGAGKLLAGSVVLSGADAANYLLTAPTLTGDITPARLLVRALDDARTANGTPYQGGAGVVYDGFVGGESAGVLGGQLRYGGTAQGASAAGRYTITASGLQATNYDIRYADGTLVLREQAQVPPGVAASQPEALAVPGIWTGQAQRRRSAVVAALSATRDESSSSDDTPAELLTVVGSGMRLPEGLVGE